MNSTKQLQKSMDNSLLYVAAKILAVFPELITIASDIRNLQKQKRAKGCKVKK